MPKPKTLTDFEDRFPKVWKTYEAFRDACDAAGALDAKTRELVKVGIQAALGRRGGLVAHIERARRAGAKDDEILHAVLLATPLAGMPEVLDAFRVAKERMGE